MRELFLEIFSSRSTFEKLFSSEGVIFIAVRFRIDKFPWTWLHLRCPTTLSGIVLRESALQIVGLADVPGIIMYVFENVYDVHDRNAVVLYGPAKLASRRRGTHSCVARHEVAKPLFVAGEVGIEPTHTASRARCLTTWLLPKIMLTH